MNLEDRIGNVTDKSYSKWDLRKVPHRHPTWLVSVAIWICYLIDTHDPLRWVPSYTISGSHSLQNRYTKTRRWYNKPNQTIPLPSSIPIFPFLFLSPAFSSEHEEFSPLHRCLDRYLCHSGGTRCLRPPLQRRRPCPPLRQ